jgi:hypothetical protein
MPPPQHLTAVDTDGTATASYIVCQGREELHWAAGGEPRPGVRAGFTEELTGYRSRGGDRVHSVGEVPAVLDERFEVAEPLVDDALRPVVVVVRVLPHRRGVLGADDLHALRRQALERVDNALVEPDDGLKPDPSHARSTISCNPVGCSDTGRELRDVLGIPMASSRPSATQHHELRVPRPPEGCQYLQELVGAFRHL